MFSVVLIDKLDCIFLSNIIRKDYTDKSKNDMLHYPNYEYELEIHLVDWFQILANINMEDSSEICVPELKMFAVCQF